MHKSMEADNETKMLSANELPFSVALSRCFASQLPIIKAIDTHTQHTHSQLSDEVAQKLATCITSTDEGVSAST